MLADKKYAHIWSKYRPVILSLMKSSTEGVQSYQLSGHEFVDINPKKVSGYAFNMQLHERKTLKDIRKSLLAPDLMAVLRLSASAMELSETSIYTFELDKHFLLQISSESIDKTDDNEAEEIENEKETIAVLEEEVKS